MPRPSNIRPTPRDSRDPERRAEQLRVAARPIESPIAPPDAKYAQLSEALSSISPGLTRIAQKRSDDQAEAGAMAREGALPGAVMPDNQGSMFEYGWRVMSGKRDALAAKAQMQQDYAEKFNPETDNLEEFLTKYKPDEKRAEPEYQKAFGSVLMKAKDGLREVHQKATLERKSRDMLEGAGVFLTEAVRDINSNPNVPPAAKLEAIQRVYTDFRAVNPAITNRQLDEILVQTVENEALQGRDGVMEALKLRKADGTPGLWDHPVHGEKLVKLSAIAQEARTKAVMANLESLQFDTLGQAREMAEKDTLTRAWLQKKVDAKILSGERADSLWGDYIKKSTDKQVMKFAVEAIKTGSIEGLATVHGVKGGKDIAEKAFIALSEEAMQDPTKGLPYIVNTGMRVNMMHPEHEFVLNGASPLNGPSFKHAATMYKSLLTANPNYIHRFVKDSPAAQYDAYWGAKRMGLTDEESLGVVQKVGDVAAMREAMSAIRSDFARRDGLHSKTVDEFKNPPNANEITERVRDLTAYRVALGNTTNEAAWTWAVARVKAQYEKFEGYQLFNGGKVLSSSDRAALQFYLGRKSDDLQAQGLTEASDGLRLYADESTLVNGDYVVQFASSGRPVARINLGAVRNLAQKHVTDPKLQALVNSQNVLQKRAESESGDLDFTTLP